MEPYFQAIHHTALGEWMRAEVWRVPTIEIVHIFGIVLLFGSLLVVNLRLFGFVLRAQPVGQLADGVMPFQKLGLMLIALSGPVLFVTSAVKCYNTPSFWWKMGFLASAIAYQFLVHMRLIRQGNAGVATAAASLFLWGGVLLNGMWTLLS